MLVYLDENDAAILMKFSQTNYYGFEEYQVLQRIVEQVKEQKLAESARLTCEEDS